MHSLRRHLSAIHKTLIWSEPTRFCRHHSQTFKVRRLNTESVLLTRDVWQHTCLTADAAARRNNKRRTRQNVGRLDEKESRST